MIWIKLNQIANGGTIHGKLEVIFDGNEKGNQDFGIRSPDNLDWADDGLVYINEDRSVNGFGAESGREASIWQLNPYTSDILQIGEIDRTAVPAGQTDFDPNDLGDWETSGILDVAHLFGEGAGKLFLTDVQAHSLGGGVIASDNLVEGGQLLFLQAAGCPGDINGDGTVDVVDLLLVVQSFGPCGGCPADINGDGTVDVVDLLLVIQTFGPCG